MRGPLEENTERLSVFPPCESISIRLVFVWLSVYRNQESYCWTLSLFVRNASPHVLSVKAVELIEGPVGVYYFFARGGCC